MSVTKPWKQWEGGFYRRTLQSTLHKDASSLFTYHHHVLMGCTLWMVRKEIEPNEEPEYKFSKVQGTRKGRLRGLVLNTDSEVRGSIHNEQLEGIFNRRTKHMIDVTGKCHFEQSESTWQLVTLSKAVYEEWMERLHSATGFLARLEESGEAKQLYHIAQKVKASVRSRTHWYKFVAYANSFCGYRAVSAIGEGTSRK
ncbi:hypothetical protein EON65_29665 [archaeon]|nr:MAG: hypothetical protein EON65_29665 [archaeon]